MLRIEIIEKLTKLLEGNINVHAAWLEGSDANGNLDEYSDIDFCSDIDEHAIDKVFDEIQKNFSIDSIYESKYSDTERQLVFHIKGTSRFLVVDFTAYIHGKANNTFIIEDNIDVCKVIFDKKGIIQYKDYDPSEGSDARAYWTKESKYRFSQIGRVEKYCLRGLFPEAFIYYNKYVIEPLVFILRSIYTPTKVWYYMVHISRHIPKEEIERLNKILQVACTDDILNNLSYAEEWYKELLAKINS